jgi:hypothetical protein
VPLVYMTNQWIPRTLYFTKKNVCSQGVFDPFLLYIIIETDDNGARKKHES